jgi:hypothetical protein
MDWKKKLTSRKFWMAVAAFIVGIVIYLESPDKSNPESITALVMVTGSVVAYIVGEGFADGANKQ